VPRAAKPGAGRDDRSRVQNSGASIQSVVVKPSGP
jgi:hypothetical protein